MISLWEKESLLNYDAIIIGAGITGLSTAASIKEQAPHLSVLVIERGALPSGASTKNAGFACFGSVSELLEDQKILGTDGMCALVEKRWKGLNKTRQRLSDQSIGFESTGGYELIRKDDQFNSENIHELNRLLENIVGEQIFSLMDHQLEKFEFKDINHLIFNQYEGALHTGKLINSLWDYCGTLGVRIITGTAVTSIHSENGYAVAHSAAFSFKGKALAICTNAFTKSLIKDIELKPGRGMVMLVKPDKPMVFKGTFQYDQGYFYFRDFQDKLLFGGGRNLDVEGETSLEFGINHMIQQKLEEDIRNVILPDQPYTIEMMWSGIMAFGDSKTPVIQQVSENTFMGVRLGGMGVAIGSMVGEDLANLIFKSHF